MKNVKQDIIEVKECKPTEENVRGSKVFTNIEVDGVKYDSIFEALKALAR